MDTSRVDGVKAPQHRGTPRSHITHLEIFHGLRGRHLYFQFFQHDLELFEVWLQNKKNQEDRKKKARFVAMMGGTISAF